MKLKVSHFTIISASLVFRTSRSHPDMDNSGISKFEAVSMTDYWALKKSSDRSGCTITSVEGGGGLSRLM